jgi:hypothetical protein
MEALGLAWEGDYDGEHTQQQQQQQPFPQSSCYTTPAQHYIPSNSPDYYQADATVTFDRSSGGGAL